MESTSEEGQLPQVVEELKDLQVAPGTRLAKFQLKVKGEEDRPPAGAAWATTGALGVEAGVDHSPVATGYPAPRLYWFKDGQPLTASEHIHMADRKTLHTLEVVSVTREDAGQYSAYISNAVGAAYSSARLLVRGGSLALGVHIWAASVPGHQHGVGHGVHDADPGRCGDTVDRAEEEASSFRGRRGLHVLVSKALSTSRCLHVTPEPAVSEGPSAAQTPL